MLFQQFPFEIRQRIFEYVSSLDKVSLKNCSTVCKSWYQETAYAIYQTFTLSGDPNLCISVLSSQANERRFTDHVKVLKAFSDYRYRGINLYDRMNQYFPSLQVLDLSESECQMVYLKSMVNKCQTMRNLRKIKVDPHFDDMYDFWVYFDCVYSLRHTLTYLELLNLDYNVRNSHTFPHFLKDFINLKEIVIRSPERGTRSVSLFPLLELVPGLIRFSIEDDFEGGTGIDIPLPSKVAYPCLEEATIRIPSFNDQLMKYVVSSFPRTLKKFDLSITNMTTEDWIRKNNRHTIESFGTYLSKIEQVEFSIKSCPRTVHLNSFSPSVLKEYWPFISKAMFTDHIKKWHVSISLNPSHYHNPRKPFNFSIKKSHNQVYIDCIFGFDGTVLQSFQQQQPNFFDVIFPLPQEASSFLKQTISSIELLCKPPSEGCNFFPISDSIQILKSTIIEYTNLTYFHFGNSGNYGQLYHIRFGTKLQDLEGSHGPYPSVSHGLPWIGTKRSVKQKITHALVESSRFTILDLNAIYDVLPDITYLKLLEYKLEKEPEQVMDVRHMETLKTLVFDIGFLRYQFQFGMTLRIEFEKDKLVRWYKWCETSRSFIRFKKFISRFRPRWPTKRVEFKKVLVIQCFDLYEINLLLEGYDIGKFIHPLKKKKKKKTR